MSDALVNKTRTDHPQPGIGHNRPSLNEAAQANVRSGVLLLCKEALITAIQDRRLHRDHLRVLAAIAMFVNTQTAKAWPSRAAVASLSGLTVRGVSNALLELRNWGYLIADRETVEEANNRRLTVYTFGNIDHEEIRRQIANICFELQKRRSATEEKSPPKVTTKSSQEVTVTPGGDEQVTPQGDFPKSEVTPQGGGKSPPAVHSNSIKEQSKTSPNGEGANAPSASLRQIVWRSALEYLKSVYQDSVAEAALRSRLGLLVKEHGEGFVLNAIAQAQRAEAIDPMDYAQGILAGPTRKPKPGGQLPAWKAEINDKLARMRAANRKG